MIALALLLQAQIPSDAYADAATRDLVHELRAARARNERLVTSYTVRASQRMGMGLRAVSRDRMLWRQELVADIHWRRDSISTATVVGAREAVPVADARDQLPSGLRGGVNDLVVDPASDYLHVVGMDDDDGIVYPLRDGGELDYRYAIGGTTTLGLPDGRQISIVALEITPRRADWRLMSGTLWFDQDTKGLVRAAFRPARPFELQRDLDPDDAEDVPGWINVKAEVRFITLEYGLQEGRWWMPRYVAIDAAGSMGRWLNVPFRLERIYRDYEVQGGTPPDTSSGFVPAGRSRWVTVNGSRVDSITRERISDSLRAAVRACTDSLAQAGATDSTTRRQRMTTCRERHLPDNLTVIVPADTQSVINSAELGEPILQMGDMITEAELESLQGAIEQIPDRPWQRHFEVPDGFGAVLRHARYNRIEALSLGASMSADLGRFRIEALGRIGLGDGEPNGELALVRETPNVQWRLGVSRDLTAMNPELRPFGMLASSMALFAGRDDGEYFRTRGVSLEGSDLRAGHWTLSVWHRRESPALVETQFSLPHLLDGDHLFRGNLAADEATQTGASLTLRQQRPFSASSSISAELSVDGATGDYDYLRGSATLHTSFALGSRQSGGITVAAGTSRGQLPMQAYFLLGGAATLRGYHGAATGGEAFWRARAEFGRGQPAARLIGFVDAGWAGARNAFGRDNPLVGVGIGASLLDGLVRFDLTRGLSEGGGTRFEVYFDGLI
ncbi:MAG TPA: ShlB/FhaC/HecB family hemolysin secretion/activation protein [Gemmatimonadales bacterium]|nr:ShlB/FhaC/HecB family hemolysin secretion/activation protein [Gemmatimonadales bacterium]